MADIFAEHEKAHANDIAQPGWRTVTARAKAEAALIVSIRRARTSFSFFVEFVMRDNDGKALQLAPLHLAWHRHVDYCWSKGMHAGIMAPWGHGKTSGLIIPLTAYLLGKNPAERIKIICQDDESAQKRVGKFGVGGVIKSNPAFRAVFPDVHMGKRETNHEFYLDRGLSTDPNPSLQAHGVMTAGIGSRATTILFDDVVDQKNSLAPDQREKVKALVHGTWMSRLQPKGRCLWISTPWHLDDATHALMRKPGWCFLIQRVNESITGIEQEVVNAQDDYPLLTLPEELLAKPA